MVGGLVNRFLSATIKKKILFTVMGILSIVLAVIMLIFFIQSGAWFKEEAKDKLNVAANIILNDIRETSKVQHKDINSIALDENIILNMLLVKELLEENPNAKFDDAYEGMTQNVAGRVETLSLNNPGIALVEVYDVNRNLVAFYKKSGSVLGWLIGGNKYMGTTSTAAKKGILALPPDVIARYVGEIPSAVENVIDIYGNYLSAVVNAPISSEEAKGTVGFIRVKTIFDEKYAQKMSTLTNTKINFFTGKNFSSGLLENYKLISNDDYSSMSSVSKGSKDFLSLDASLLFTDSELSLDGEGYYQILYPFFDKAGGKVIGSMAILYSKGVAQDKKNVAVFWLVIIFVAAMVVSYFIAVWFSSVITNPLMRAVEISNKLAQGDFNIDIHVESEDETGKLLNTMDHTITSLRGILKQVTGVTEKVNLSSKDILKGVTNQSVIAQQQVTSVTEITTTVEELSQTSTQIADNSKAVAKDADDAVKDAESGVKAVEINKSKMQKINEDNRASLDEILSLGRKSEEITKVIELIKNIAEQTKLIAFNAAIEASSTEVDVKRFNVVATEIRELASSVTGSIGEIENKIKEIQNAIKSFGVASDNRSKSIQEGIESSNVLVDVLDGILNSAKSTSQLAKQISLSTQQQKTGSDQVVSALKDIQKGSQHTYESIRNITDITNTLDELSNNLNKEVKRFNI